MKFFYTASMSMLFCYGHLYAQVNTDKCSFTLSGKVYSGETHQNLSSVSVEIKELNKGMATNDSGVYHLNFICAGSYTVQYSHVGHKTFTCTLHIQGNHSQDVTMHFDTCSIHEILIVKRRGNDSVPLIQPQEQIKGKELDKTRGLSLGESLKSLAGVYTIQTGPSISKPVIHGLHSNRILILNNGIRQEGQQWGSEHAPEIDPFIATNLIVVKGAASIRYGSDAIGGVILVEPKKMRINPGIGGEINLVGMSNGYAGTSSAMLDGAFGKKFSGLSWRVQGTYKRSGNSRTAYYYMDNTASKEINYSATLAYTKKNYGAELYYSSFFTQLGIFSGTHAEAVSDILSAIKRDKPLTPDVFTYTIDRPYQLVQHNLFKAKAYYKSEKLGRFELTFASQQNERSEYGYIPFTGKLNPELYLRIQTQTLDGIWEHKSFKNIKGSIGFNGITQGNVRKYEFLIPNFRNYGGGILWIEKWQKNRWSIEGGIRYDYRWMRVYMLDNTTAQVITPTYHYENFTIAAGAEYRLTEKMSISANFSTAWKAPTVNELFSKGVHQSAASYEIGNSNLVPEHAYNFNSEIKYSNKNFVLNFGAYHNIIINYTYLKPDLIAIHTIRGSFPAFSYTQANVVFTGVDVKAEYTLHKITFTTKTSYIYAYNNSIHDFLIYAPSNRIDNSIKYEIGKLGKLQKVSLGISNLNVAKQNNVPANSDFALPPAGYVLLGANINFDFLIGKQVVSVDFSVNNMLNKSYRDYLNRFRYFTDDLGRNFVLRIKVPFEFSKHNTNNN